MDVPGLRESVTLHRTGLERPTVVVHVGLKKSGSASLQTFLDENSDRLHALSIDYPKIGRRARIAHHNLAHEVRGYKRFDPQLGTLAECAQDWRARGYSTMILSSEMFEEVESDQALQMKNMLQGARPCDFRIYVVIRDLIDLMPSSYAQKVKYGFFTYDFDTFFVERMQERRVHVFQTVKRWAKAFGWENLFVRSLEHSDLLNGDLIDDFLAVCGAVEGVDKLGLVRTGVQNTSPGWRVLEAVRALIDGRHGLRANHPLHEIAGLKLRRGVSEARRRGFLLGECAIQVGEPRRWNAERGRYLTREQAQACLDIHCRSVVLLNRKLDRKLSLPRTLGEREFSAREFKPDVSQIPREELNSFYDDLWDAFRNSAKNP